MDKSKKLYKKHFNAVVFDHDGTLVDTSGQTPRIFPGIDTLLMELSARNVDLYLWSLRPRASLIRITKDLALYDYFRDLRGGDDCSNPKPHSQGLSELLAGYELDRVCHIGDGGGDFTGASSLGIPFIAACWSDPSYGKEWENSKLRYPKMNIAYKPNDVLLCLDDLGIWK